MLKSGLVLAGVNDSGKKEGANDGILTAMEISNLNLDQTTLVVLSACETGLGEVKNGEGVYGLQRAFKLANANYLVLSLWKVDDAATMELMKHFYSSLLKTGNVYNAFMVAQHELRKAYPQPYYWGAFRLIGH
jgi:CHAT domain-containing protein